MNGADHAGRPANRFVIIANPRTGSNHLVNCLNSVPGIVCHYELFHPDHIGYCTGPDRSGLAERAAAPIGFLAKTLDEAGSKTCGFKIFMYHDDTVIDYCVDAEPIKKIILYRENILAVYGSTKLAEALGVWSLPMEKALPIAAIAGSTGRKPTRQVHFDKSDFAELVQGYTAHYSRIVARLNETNQTFLFLKYTDLHNELMIRRIFPFLGLDQPWGLWSSMQRINSGAIIDRFINREEVRAYLEAHDRLGWLYEHLDQWTMPADPQT